MENCGVDWDDYHERADMDCCARIEEVPSLSKIPSLTLISNLLYINTTQ